MTARTGLLLASILSVACLLSATHKFYDALLVVLPAVWLADRVRRAGLSAATIAMGLALASLLVPGQAALWVWTASGDLPPALTGHPLWDLLVVPLHVWALLVILGLLLGATRRAPEQLARADT